MTTRDRVLRTIVALRQSIGFPPLQKEIAAAAGICRGNLARALAHLEREGRIARRSWHIQVTAAGLSSIAVAAE